MGAGAPPNEKRDLAFDLLRALQGAGIYRPHSIPKEHVIDEWFADSEEQVAEHLIEALCKNSGVPLEYETENRENICLTDRKAVDEYISNNRDDPYWSA